MGFLNNQSRPLIVQDDIPFEVYQAVSSSEIKSLTSFSRSSFTVPGKMTDDHGRAGLEIGDSQLATRGLMMSESAEERYIRVIVDI